MIVKNESQIIERCLESVKNIIDFLVICDTGSNDNTIKKIINFMEKYKIKGVIKKIDFHNFSQARNETLNLARKYCDYILLLDADMILINKNFKKTDLEQDVYYLIQNNNGIKYKNIRIIKNNNKWFYEGFTHEILSCEQNVVENLLTSIYIEDIDDGGCKENKLTRDIQLLRKDKKSSRNTFYLANTYFSLFDFVKAKEYYIKYLQNPGWSEEIWFSFYRLGIIAFLDYHKEEILFNFNKCNEINNKRIEHLYYLYIYFIKNKLYQKGYNILENIINNLNNDKNNFLFVDEKIYNLDWKKEMNNLKIFFNINKP